MARTLTFRPTYTDGATEVVFTPDDRTPGFTHKVLIIDTATRTLVGKDWLGAEFKPSAKTAAFYLEKFKR